jgi:hypothetical protein
MERKVAQTELNNEEYETLQKTAQKKGLTIKEALRQAAAQWVLEESGINPSDPIFHPPRTTLRLRGKELEKARRASEEVDETVYQ